MILIYQNMPLVYDVFLSPDNKELFVLFNSIFNVINNERYSKIKYNIKKNNIFFNLNQIKIFINEQEYKYTWIGKNEYKELISIKIDNNFEKLKVKLIIDKITKEYILEKKIDRNKYKDKIGIMTHFKNENEYLLPWIYYYDKMGIDYFFIYNNNPKNKDYYDIVKEKYGDRVILCKWGFPFELNLWPSGRSQMAAFTHCLKKYRNMKWIGFFDLDEYVVPLKDLTIKNFLDKFNVENISTIAIECMWFGCGRGIECDNTNFLEKLTFCKGETEKRRDKEERRMRVNAKCFHNPRNAIVIGNHKVVEFKGEYLCMDDKEIRFNHYFTLSKWGRDRFFTKKWKGNKKEIKKKCNCEVICKVENKDILQRIH